MRVRRVVIGLVAGLILGSLISASGVAAAVRVADVLQPVGELWVNAIRMTIVPLVVSLLFVAIAGRAIQSDLGRLGIATLATFLALLVFAAAIGVLLAPPLIRDLKLSADAAASLRSAATVSSTQTAAHIGALPGFGAWFIALVPVNAIAAAADGALLPLIVFTLLFALASQHIDERSRRALVDFFSAIAGAMTRVVDWIILAAPIGIFALVTAAASHAGAALAGAMLYYVVAIVLSVVLFALLLYPVAVIVGGLSLGWFTRIAARAQTVALGTSSSLASLPALVEGGRTLGLSDRVNSFVLPLAVSTFKVVTPIYWLVGTLFLAKLYGVALHTSAVVTVALTGVALSLTIPGVPQGAQLLLAPLLVTYGIPAEGIALLIAVDTIPDLFGTFANVTGDLVAATVVARYEMPVVDDQVGPVRAGAKGDGVAESAPAVASSSDG